MQRANKNWDGLWNLKATPPGLQSQQIFSSKVSRTFPNSITSWGARVQTHKPKGDISQSSCIFFPVSCRLSASSIEPNHTYQLFLLPHEFLDLTHPPGSRTPPKGLLFPESTSVCQWEADQDHHVPLESPRAPTRQPLCISSVQREGKKHFILGALEWSCSPLLAHGKPGGRLFWVPCGHNQLSILYSAHTSLSSWDR